MVKFQKTTDDVVQADNNSEDLEILQELIMTRPDLMMSIISVMTEMKGKGIDEEEIIEKCSDILSDEIEKDGDPFQFFAPRKRKHGSSANRKPCNVNATLSLKIQLKDVTKPPCWRQILVPAKFTFLQLHNIIQVLFRLDDEHLWMFQEKAYDSDVTIGIPTNDDGFGVDDTSHNAQRTKLNKFLTAEGDKLEYVYDFGNDWIFTVTVKKITTEPCKHAVCEKFKSPVQCLDYQGPWAYETLREMYLNRDKITKKQLQKYADDNYMEVEDIIPMLDDLEFDIDFINEELKDIPNSILTY